LCTHTQALKRKCSIFNNFGFRGKNVPTNVRLWPHLPFHLCLPASGTSNIPPATVSIDYPLRAGFLQESSQLNGTGVGATSMDNRQFYISVWEILNLNHAGGNLQWLLRHKARTQSTKGVSGPAATMQQWSSNTPARASCIAAIASDVCLVLNGVESHG
jgi:hypothetical protein